ncbi:guanosine-5'-triphosphate,3'-diphosphate diphosphatase [Motilimonas cestriensis]|uniref:guanosine-5'-triphosphate,3'-diphosphate diphosphatase n=1 Tax=Motilimonas cestriensis TaxID=2742685 RepID=UPI003DA3D745
MSSKSPLYAAIDLGSNSFHMLVVREVEDAIRTIAKVKRKVRLAEGLDDDFNLSHDAMVRGWQCLSLFAEQLQDIPAENIRIVGTATLRLAKNVNTFLEQAETILNHKIDIISGLEEAATIYQGVAQTSCGEGNRLVIDIGGASTELVIGAACDALLLNSVNMGCVTWLKRYFPDQKLNDTNFNAAINGAKQVLKDVAQDYLNLGWQNCVGASGTVQSLQNILKAQGLNEQVTLDKLLELKQQSIECGSLGKLKLQGLSSERLAVFPSGLAILIAIFEYLDIDSMTLAGGALREGLVYSMIGESQYQGVRERTLKSLISRYQIDQKQALHVKKTAVLLYKAMAEALDLDDEVALPMLTSAATLYEIGLCIEYKKAPQHAAYIIDNIDLPGFTPAQQQLLAALLFNQRGKLALDMFAQQNALDLNQAVSLCRLLRLAIILCMRRTKGSIPNFTLSDDDGAWTLSLPSGWLAEHALRAAELEIEVEQELKAGLQLTLVEQPF